MSTTTAPAADVNAADETVETKSTTTEDSSSKETKETSALDTSKADKEILDDLGEDKPDDSNEESDESKKDGEPDTSEETEKLRDEAIEKANSAKGAEARKESLNNEIRELVSKRNEARKEYEAEIAKNYRTETVEELEDQGLSPEDAEKEVLRQENEMLKFNQHVSDLNGTLNIEALQVMQDFPVFDPESPLYDKDLSGRVRELYQQAAQPQVDEKTGFVLKSNLTPYAFYKAFAETHQASGEKSRVQGQIDGQKAADKELAAAEVPSSTAPRTQKQDPFLKGLLSDDD